MNKGQKLSVACIEDDQDFSVLLGSVFLSSELFDLKGLFNSIEAFTDETSKQSNVATWLPDVLVVDVMLGGRYAASVLPFGSGATFANELRSEGAKCAIVLVSAMKLDTVIKSFNDRNPRGWRALLKTSRLTSNEILNAALEAAEEMKLP